MRKNCKSCSIISRPRDPGCTGSLKKCALKNHSEGFTSFSARSRPVPAEPPCGQKPVTRSIMRSAGPGSRSAPAKYFSCRSERSTMASDGSVRRALSSGGMGSPACVASVSRGKYPKVASSLQMSFSPTVHRIRYEMMMTPDTRVTEMTFAWVTSVPASGNTSSVTTMPAPSRLRKKTSSVVESGQPT